MTRIIGVLNYKGGTGKTTTVVNLGAGLAMRGARVLGIDLDAQGSLATHLGVQFTHSLTQLLVGQVRAQACITQARDNFDLIASDGSLLQAEGELWRMTDRQTAQRALVHKLRGVAEAYDFVLVDFSPSASLLSESGLMYTRELVVPVSANYLGMVGLRQVIETLKTLRQAQQGAVGLYLVVPTLFSAQEKQDQEALNILKRYFGTKVTRPIRTSIKVAESSSHHMSIYEYSPRSAGAADYAHLVERVLRDG